MAEQISSTPNPLEPSSDASGPVATTPQDGPTPSAPSERVTAEPGAVATGGRPSVLEEASLPQGGSDRPTTSQPSTHQPWRRLTRRQVLIGGGIVVGAAAIGTGVTLAIRSQSSTPSTSPAPFASKFQPTATVAPLPTQTPGSEQKLQAWRTNRLTVQPSQRFQHQRGTALVPLGVVEPTYPNPYNPYHIHLQGYVLGGVLVARTQFFLYLGLASLDGSQFVAKVRVGPVDQPNKTFGLLVVQQSTDAIEGGPAEFPQVTLAPRAIYQALPALVDHCIEVVFIRQPLPADQDEIPARMLLEVNQQAAISNQFLRADYEAIHHTPLAQLPTSKLDPIRHLIDDSPVAYRSATDASRYPVVTQLTLRHTDQLYPKLVSG